jgi:hypothetical protein
MLLERADDVLVAHAAADNAPAAIDSESNDLRRECKAELRRRYIDAMGDTSDWSD